MTAMTATVEVRKQPLGASVGIPPRRMDFDFEPAQTTRHYVDGDAAKTAFVTGLSAMFPRGEQYFVDAVRNYRHRITDETLKAQVSGFIGQEAMHAKEHREFNDTAREHGYAMDSLDGSVRRILWVAYKFPKAVRLAVTVCLEHFTGIFAEMLLRDKELHGQFSPDMQRLWLWHALEESEHKAVAWDVYAKHVRSYWLRVTTMVPTTLIFFAVALGFQLRLLAAHKEPISWRQYFGSLKYLFWGRQGKFSRLLPQYFDFYKPSFHPNQHDTSELLVEWREKLFGSDGMLKDQVKG